MDTYVSTPSFITLQHYGFLIFCKEIGLYDHLTPTPGLANGECALWRERKDWEPAGQPSPPVPPRARVDLTVLWD